MMETWKRIAGIIFLAAVSVYSDRASGATADGSPGSAGYADGGQTIPTNLKSSDSDGGNMSTVQTPTPENPTGSNATVANSSAESSSVGSQPTPDAASGTSTQPVIVPVAPSGDKAAPAKLTASDNGTFSIQINNDINIVDVLRMIGNQAQISIVPSKDVRGTVPAMDLYNVTVNEALDAILHTNGFAYQEKGNFIYVYTQKEMDAIQKAAHQTVSEVFHLYYTPAANAATIIKPVLSVDGLVAMSTPAVSGIDTGTKDAGGDSHATDDVIVVTDYPENLEKVQKVLKEIDRRPQQILLEATILQATLNETNSLGIDFSVMGGINFSDIAAAPYTGGNLAASGSLTGAGGGQLSGGTGTATGGGATNYTAANTGFTQNVPNGGLQLGVVYNNIGVFLKALEQTTDTVVLANPKILALNKQRGEVHVGREDGYITTEVTQTSQTQTVDFLDTGTYLVFRPYIGDDGYIRMEIHPEDSSGGLSSANLPYKVTTECTSNIMVKDGHTIVIGGLFRESNQTSRSQVPLLGNLPLVGPLFRSQTDATVREEIIILLTPHIIKDDAAYSQLSEAELREAERLRVGVREGMMPFGRERKAESCYEQAVAEMRKPSPDVDKAVWYLDCATNLNPQFSEAIDMKEKLTGHVVETSDNATIRSFVTRSILADMATESPAPIAKPEDSTRPGASEKPDDSAPRDPSLGDPSNTAPRPSADPEKVSPPATQPSVASGGE